ncbi:MAG: Dam family site-specific DNA-(adenine-N6)-methyltransferase [Candidatus Cybelea sp.]
MEASRRFDSYDDWYARARRARPFLRWAGGKQPFLIKHPGIVPTFTGRYIEPFLGGASVFFHIMRTQPRPCPAVLGDINRELITTYAAIKADPYLVYERLLTLQAGFDAGVDKAEYYNSMRQLFNAQRPKVDGALFIFINRTCWNGLYRTNKDGVFNVPYGNPKSDRVVPRLEDLLDVHAALQQAELRNTAWENTLATAERGDFVFLDPPYFSDCASESIKYSRYPFTEKHHFRLASHVGALADRGIAFVLTNSGEEQMESLYRSLGLSVRRINVPRYISSKTDERVATRELLVTPKGLG